jgi:hypothetical protein
MFRREGEHAMTTKNKTRIGTGCATFALLALGFLALTPADAATAVRGPGGAVRFYDDRGQDRGFAWCLKRGGRQFSGWSDCSYFSFAQCQASIINPPGGTCDPNPFSYEVAPPPPARRARR